MLQERMEALAGERFNSCLLNLYRDGRDAMGWHSDNEALYGSAPTIGAPPAPPCGLSTGLCTAMQLMWVLTLCPVLSRLLPAPDRGACSPDRQNCACEQ